MRETLCRTTSRLAPAISTPPTRACLMADKNPKRINATRIDNSVSNVRAFLRFRLLQMSGRNFMGGSLDSLVSSGSVSELNHPRNEGCVCPVEHRMFHRLFLPRAQNVRQPKGSWHNQQRGDSPPPWPQ